MGKQERKRWSGEDKKQAPAGQQREGACNLGMDIVNNGLHAVREVILLAKEETRSVAVDVGPAIVKVKAAVARGLQPDSLISVGCRLDAGLIAVIEDGMCFSRSQRNPGRPAHDGKATVGSVVVVPEH